MNNIIYLQIDEAQSFAWVSEIVHRHHNMFKVSFKDGYENVFYTDVETGAWIEEDLGFTSLANDVGKQIRTFMRNPIHVPKLLTWHKQYIDDKLVWFGFFNFMNGSQKFYQIYNSNRKYMYTLVDMDNDEWQILGNNAIINHYIDTAFVQNIIQILPLYAANAK
ncbi:hypothetical protein BH11BAC4_BH11BAC4_10330 [soil metagenome]